MEPTSRPPKVLETIAGFLIPSSVREQVLGDLHERYKFPLQYVSDVIRTVPFVIASRTGRKLKQPVRAKGGRAMVKVGVACLVLGLSIIAVLTLNLRMTELQIFLLVVLPFPLKAVALWKAARQREKWWFVALLVTQTAGALDLVYLLVNERKSVPQ